MEFWMEYQILALGSGLLEFTVTLVKCFKFDLLIHNTIHFVGCNFFTML